MWRYSQHTGEFTDNNGKLFCTGFAGNGTGLNNPLMDHVRDTGPLPQGRYTMIGFITKHPHVGLAAIALSPLDESKMYGRSDFYIHGLNIMNPLASSEGCICLGDQYLRQALWESGDHLLEVVA